MWSRKKRGKFDAISAYFEQLEPSVADANTKRTRKRINFFQKPSGVSSSKEGNSSFSSIFSLFDSERLQSFRSIVSKLSTLSLTSEDINWIRSTSKNVPLLTILGGFVFALLYSPTFATGLAARSGWRSLIRFLLSFTVIIASRSFDNSSSFSTSNLLLILVAIAIQTLSLRHAANSSTTTEKLPILESSALQLLVLELLPFPFADWAQWAVLTSSIFQKDFLGSTFEYMENLYKEVLSKPKLPSLDLMLVSMFVFLSTGLYLVKKMSSPPKDKIKARL